MRPRPGTNNASRSTAVDALVRATPDDPAVVRLAGRRVLDPLLGRLGVAGGAHGRKSTPAVSRRRGPGGGALLLGLDPLGGGGEVEQGAAEGDRADHEPAE